MTDQSRNFGIYRKNGFLSDGTVVSRDGKTFKVHRIILASASRFFDSGFQQTTSAEQDLRVDLDGDSLSLILDWMYEQKVDFRSPRHACEILVGSKIIECPGLEEVAQHYVEGSVNVECAFTLWNFARANDLIPVQRMCMDCVAKSFPTVLEKQYPELLALPDSDFMDLMNSDELIVSKEETVLDLVEQRMEKMKAEKSSSSPWPLEERLNMYEAVRFPLLVTAKLTPTQALARFNMCHDRLQKACATQDPPTVQPRLPLSCVYLLEKNYSRTQKKLVIYGLDPRASIIRKLYESVWVENLPHGYGATLFNGNEIVLIRSKPATTLCDEFHIFGLNVETWQLRRLPPMPGELCDLNDNIHLLTLKDCVLVLHIQRATLPETTKIYEYRSDHDGWESYVPWGSDDVVDLIDPRFLSLHGKAFLVDGLSIVGLAAKVFAFNDLTHSFDRMEDIPDVQRFYPKTCEWKHRLLIYGGFPPFPAVHKYLSTFLEWQVLGSTVMESDIRPANPRMSHFRVVPCDNGLLAYQSNWKAFDCEYYEERVNSWKTLNTKLDSSYNLVDMLGAVTVDADKVSGFSRRPTNVHNISDSKLQKALHLYTGSVWSVTAMIFAVAASNKGN